MVKKSKPTEVNIPDVEFPTIIWDENNLHDLHKMIEEANK